MTQDTPSPSAPKPQTENAPASQPGQPPNPAKAPPVKPAPAAPKPAPAAQPAPAPKPAPAAPAAKPAPAPTPAPAAPAAKPAPAAQQPAPAPKPAPAAQKPAPATPKPAPAAPVAPPAQPAKIERHHRMILASFLLIVALPIALLAGYLWGIAKDQYASHLGFSVRSESSAQPLELLGGLTGISSSSGSDPDILYKFINSPALVQAVDQQLDLRAIWRRDGQDPLFAYRGSDRIEDLHHHWERKVKAYYDSGMLDIRVLAFTPEDAQHIAQAIFDESQKMINDLNDIAREDAIRYAREELTRAVDRLKLARQAMTEFRDRYQLVDPTADVQGQLGLLAELQKQLAESVIGLELLKSNARGDDPRIQQQELRIKVINEQIAQERQKFGGAGESGEQLSSVVGEYEGLAVDRQFAETAYTAALAAFDTAQAEARRTSRYLAAYTKPTLAETAEYPKRARLLAITGFFLILSWVVGVLIYYSVRNRR